MPVRFRVECRVLNPKYNPGEVIALLSSQRSRVFAVPVLPLYSSSGVQIPSP
jgi:hypothetical protein